jgi:DNA-binding NarL/FixJ family response regulator
MAAGKRTPTHLFLDDRAVVLPRWQEAFRAVRVEPIERAQGALADSSLVAVWLRLQAARAAHKQMQELAAITRGLPVVVLSDRPDEEEALAVLAAGARGYCNSHAAPALLRRAWAVVEAGGLWVGEALMLRLVRATARGAPVAWPAHAGPLTAKEREVMEPLARGESCSALARSLGVSERAVKTRLRSLMDKLEVSDRFALTRRLVVTFPPKRAGLHAGGRSSSTDDDGRL